MILTRNNFHQFAKFILGVVILCLAFTITTHSTFAAQKKTIEPSQLKVLFSKSLSRSLQGATMTKDYYIYTDWSCDGCKTNLIKCTRSQPSKCSTLASGYYGHASTVYHEWGSDTVTVVGNGDQNYRNACININSGKTVSGCKKITPSGLGATDGSDSSSWLQGYTWYGDYGLRGWGYYPKTGTNKLLIYKNGSIETVYKLPSSGDKKIYEIEGVAVDGDTGDIIIIAKSTGSGTVKFFQVSSSVINLGSGGSGKREAKKSAARKKEASDYDNNYTPTVSTYDGTVDTLFFGTLQDDGEGCGTFTVLDLVMTILTIGIGITATIGIAVSGIIYLTAKDDVAKTTKAKRRIYEIVIGLAAYAVLWGLLTFLLPEFNPELKACKTLTSEEIAARDAEREAKRQSNQQASSGSSSKSSSSGSSSGQTTSGTDLSAWYKAYTEQAKYMKNAEYGSNYKSNFKKSKTDGTCITYVSTSLQRLGVIPKNTYIWYNCGMTGTAKKYIKERKDVFQVTYPNKTVAQLYKKGKIQKGDIVFYQYGSSCGVGHTMIFVGFNSKNKPIFNTFGHAGMKTNYAHSDGSKKVKMLIHLKKTSL